VRVHRQKGAITEDSYFPAMKKAKLSLTVKPAIFLDDRQGKKQEKTNTSKKKFDII